RPLVARFAGDAARAAYTAGPATRDALTRAGALGATPGSVVHLPEAPAAGMSSGLLEVLSHELTHARQPVGRPRFLLGARSGAMDADERAAHTVGQQAAATARTVGGATFTASGAADDGATVVRRRASLGALAGAGYQAVGGAAVPPPGSVAAGLVDQLPVGGAAGNAVSGSSVFGNSVFGNSVLGNSVFGNAISEARTLEAGLPAAVAGAVPGTGLGTGLGGDATAHGLLAALAAADPGGAASAESALSGAAAAAGFDGAGFDGAGLAGAGFNGAGPAASDDHQPGPASAPGAAAAARPAAHHLPDADVDRIVQAVEQRLLRQLERRGGRYAGVF
ncbi:MAG: DUF4157 domain-containing protein, partial [Catenulispora sp.]